MLPKPRGILVFLCFQIFRYSRSRRLSCVHRPIEGSIGSSISYQRNTSIFYQSKKYYKIRVRVKLDDLSTLEAFVVYRGSGKSRLKFEQMPCLLERMNAQAVGVGPPSEKACSSALPPGGRGHFCTPSQ